MSQRVTPWNVPNVLTTLRLIAVPLFGWMLLAHPHETNWRIATTVVFCLAIATDFVDGWWARKYNVVTDFGKIADPIADKAITGMAFIGLSILGELWWWVTILILVREWGITVMRFFLLRRGVVLAASKGGKMKTMLQSFALIFFLLPLTPYARWHLPTVDMIPELISFALMAAAFVATIVTGLDYAVNQARGER